MVYLIHGWDYYQVTKKIFLIVFLNLCLAHSNFFAGSVNLNHVASTTVNQNGIIQPSIIYKQHKSGNIHEEKITDEAIDIQISTIEQESSRYIVEFYFFFFKLFIKSSISLNLGSLNPVSGVLICFQF